MNSGRLPLRSSTLSTCKQHNCRLPALVRNIDVSTPAFGSLAWGIYVPTLTMHGVIRGRHIASLHSVLTHLRPGLSMGTSGQVMYAMPTASTCIMGAGPSICILKTVNGILLHGSVSPLDDL